MQAAFSNRWRPKRPPTSWRRCPHEAADVLAMEEATSKEILEEMRASPNPTCASCSS
jgi:hypothetical protein